MRPAICQGIARSCAPPLTDRILASRFHLGESVAMGSYAGKKENLSRLERQLRERVQQGAPRNLLLGLAEEVRLARIRALRATKARIPPRADRSSTKGLAAKIASLETLT